jgi:hypothetical protein
MKRKKKSVLKQDQSEQIKVQYRKYSVITRENSARMLRLLNGRFAPNTRYETSIEQSCG